MQTADNVARWFLSRNAVRCLSGEADFISNPKLQKLLYYAQGIYLALYGKPLFREPIEAWQYGPAIDSVYQKYADSGADGIKQFEKPDENFSDSEESVLQLVQEAFGQFAAWKLSEMTRDEAPWQATKRNAVISLDNIKSYFEQGFCARVKYTFPRRTNFLAKVLKR